MAAIVFAGSEPVQIEVEALPPEVLRARVDEAISRWWSDEPYRAALAVEEQHRSEIEGWL